MAEYLVAFNNGCYRVFSLANLEKYYFAATAERIKAAAIWRGDSYATGLTVASEANRKRRAEIKRSKKSTVQEKLL